VEAALIEHAYPTATFDAREGEANGEAFERLQEASAQGAPDEDNPEPAGESDHDERKKESGDEELVERGAVMRFDVKGVEDGSKEEAVEAANVTGEDAECEEEEIDAREYGIDV
jgi:hypothetical protein